MRLSVVQIKTTSVHQYLPEQTGTQNLLFPSPSIRSRRSLRVTPLFFPCFGSFSDSFLSGKSADRNRAMSPASSRRDQYPIPIASASSRYFRTVGRDRNSFGRTDPSNHTVALKFLDISLDGALCDPDDSSQFRDGNGRSLAHKPNNFPRRFPDVFTDIFPEFIGGTDARVSSSGESRKTVALTSSSPSSLRSPRKRKGRGFLPANSPD